MSKKKMFSQHLQFLKGQLKNMNNFILIHLTMYINTFFERNKLEYVGKTPQSQKNLILNVWLVGWLSVGG